MTSTGHTNRFKLQLAPQLAIAAVLIAMIAMIAMTGLGLFGSGLANASSPSAIAAPVSLTAAPSSLTAPLAAAPEIVAKAGMTTHAAAGFHNSKSVALLFWLFAGMTVLGALFVITRRNMVSAVMGMVGTFFGIAALYLMLYAHFLAVIQILVYAGAIMVLFVFVIMIINRPEDNAWAMQGVAGKSVAAISLGYLLYRLTTVLWTVKDHPHAREMPITPGGFEFGSTKAVGKVLFTDYIFPFEAISIVLLIAVVGAIAIARPLKASNNNNSNSENSENEDNN